MEGIGSPKFSLGSSEFNFNDGISFKLVSSFSVKWSALVWLNVGRLIYAIAVHLREGNLRAI